MTSGVEEERRICSFSQLVVVVVELIIGSKNMFSKAYICPFLFLEYLLALFKNN